MVAPIQHFLKIPEDEHCLPEYEPERFFIPIVYFVNPRARKWQLWYKQAKCSLFAAGLVTCAWITLALYGGMKNLDFWIKLFGIPAIAYQLYVIRKWWVLRRQN